MKALKDYLIESKTKYLEFDSDENGDLMFCMYDERGELIEFDEKDINKLRDKNHGVYDPRFIKAVFDAYPKADQLSIEAYRETHDYEQILLVYRDDKDLKWGKDILK